MLGNNMPWDNLAYSVKYVLSLYEAATPDLACEPRMTQEGKRG